VSATFPSTFEAWLADQLGVADITIDAVARPAAGQSNDTTLFRAEWPGGVRDLVLRKQPTGAAIFLQPDVAREAAVLRGLEAVSGVPVPSVIGVEATGDVLGAPFFVMEQIAGRVPLARPSIHQVGWLPTLTAIERRAMWDSAMDVLVAVHACDWRAGHGFLLGDGDAADALDRHLERLVTWYRWTTDGRTYPITDLAVARLLVERSTVRTDEPVLVWGDARVGNMIFGPDHRVAAAIDWEVATIGPRAIDLAHWLFFDDFATTAAGVDRLDGWLDSANTIAEYERRAGVTVADLGYFELMDELFMATTIIRQSDMRVANGLAQPDTRMGHDNTVTQMLACRLGIDVPDLSPDYIAHRAR
jgi:aminoglycoside phosphotransferase (APT) family kinase protein